MKCLAISVSVVGATAASTGCSNDNGVFRADQLLPSFSAQVVDGMLMVGATFMDENGFGYRLRDVETLTATVGDRTIVMGDSTPDFYPNYAISFDEVTSNELAITLERPGETLESTAQLPTPLTITSVPAVSPRAMDLTIDYAAPGITGEATRADITADCLTELDLAVDPDTGVIVVPAGTLEAPGALQTCKATLVMTRLPPAGTAHADPAFDASSPGWTSVAEQATAMFKTQP